MPRNSDQQNKPHVLLVDDSPELCQAVTRVFTGSGIETHIETDGKQALALLLDHDFDLVITDIRMPQMNGDLLVKCLQQVKPGLPCIVITGLSENETRGIVSGCTNVIAVLSKPLNSQRLAVIIHGFCRADAETRSQFGFWRGLLSSAATIDQLAAVGST